MTIASAGVYLTSDASGNATGYTYPITGRIECVRYTPDPTNPFNTGGGVTITGDESKVAIGAKTSFGTSAFTLAFRQPLSAAADGSALTYDGTHAVTDKFCLSGERVKVVIASGGNTLSGTFTVVFSTDN